MKRILPLLLMLSLLLCACEMNVGTPSTPDSSASTQTVTEAPSKAPTSPPPTESPAHKRIEEIVKGDLNSRAATIPVEEMLQYPELPTGCESVALTIALNALGAGLKKTEIAELYLEYNDNFALGYVGDPFSDDGAGIFPPGIVKTVENYTGATGAGFYAEDTSGMPLNDLYKLIDAGCPVIVWTTFYLGEPMVTDFYVEYLEHFYMWYDNEHCVTLFGYDLDAGTVDIADPLDGIMTVDADEFERINQEIGSYSVALMDTADLK